MPVTQYDVRSITAFDGAYEVDGAMRTGELYPSDLAGDQLPPAPVSPAGDVTDSSSPTDSGHYVYIGSYTDPNTNTTMYIVNYSDPNAAPPDSPGFDPADTSPSAACYLYIPHGVLAPASIPATLSSTPWLICFAAGTRIGTPGGERAVETLAAGDLALTADGRARPVRWLGQTTQSRIFSDPARAYPIRIKAGALGEDRPIRDLLVSPGHALLINGVLAQAVALLNGSTIAREAPASETFNYYHVELDSHDLLLAEGVAAESFLMGGEHMNVDNSADRPAGLGLAAEMPYPHVKAARQLPQSIASQIAARVTALVPKLDLAA